MTSFVSPSETVIFIVLTAACFASFFLVLLAFAVIRFFRDISNPLSIVWLVTTVCLVVGYVLQNSLLFALSGFASPPLTVYLGFVECEEYYDWRTAWFLVIGCVISYGLLFSSL